MMHFSKFQISHHCARSIGEKTESVEEVTTSKFGGNLHDAEQKKKEKSGSIDHDEQKSGFEFIE